MPTSTIRFLSGLLAAATAVFMTYPLDVVQTYLTVQTVNPEYKGIIGTLRKISREEGFLQLYRGMSIGIVVNIETNC